MLTLLLLSTTLLARAAPFSPGPHTIPTIIHTILFGIQPRSNRNCDCSRSGPGTDIDIRTLYEIIRSCFLTIVVCVYRSIHQNIPDPRASFWERQRIRMKITFYALVAPELVIWWAMRQWFGSKVVAEKVNSLRPELSWTQTHGHFAQMGGFGRKDDKRILYPPTLIDLLKQGLINPEELALTKKEIEDKSKGDILSKTVVAFQTSWFVLECLARIQQGLPLLEIEVVTLAFATLNVLTYALWWYKPLDVLCPIYLHIRSPEPTAANLPPASNDLPQPTVVETNVDDGDVVPELGVRLDSAAPPPSIRSTPDQPHTLPVVNTTPTRPSDSNTNTNATLKNNTVRNVVNDIHQYTWTQIIKRPFRILALPLWELFHDASVHENSMSISHFYAMRIPIAKYRLAKVLSCVIGMIFGGIHFLSWDAKFPTKAERILWRMSSVILVVQPLLMLITEAWKRNYWSKTRFKDAAGVLYNVSRFFAFYIGPVPYILARFTLLLVAFLALRNVSSDAFSTVTWTFYIPHV